MTPQTDAATMSERNPERDENSGQFSENYPAEDFTQAIRERDLPTTGDVAEAVDCNRRTAYVRLTKMEVTGDVTSKEVGNALVWSVSE